MICSNGSFEFSTRKGQPLTDTRMTGAVRRGAGRFALVAALALMGCGGGPAGLFHALPEGGERVWPLPPEAPRVRLVATFSTASHLGFSRSFLRRMAAVVFGGDRRQRIRQPYGIAVAEDGAVYVVDTASGGVHGYDFAGSEYRFLGASHLEAPIGIAVSPEGLLYVSDPEQGAVVILDRDGALVRRVTQGLVRPTGLAWDALSGTALVVDTGAHQVVRMDATGAVVDRIGGRGEGDGKLNFPTNVTVGPLGRVYVSDTMNFRVQVFDELGVYMGQIGEMGTGEGQFARPKGVGVNERGYVFVVEGLYDVVNIFDADGRLLLTFGNAGSAPGAFWLASGLAVDGQGRIYVADTYNSRVQVFELVDGEMAE